jgi:hypothetical protein
MTSTTVKKKKWEKQLIGYINAAGGELCVKVFKCLSRYGALIVVRKSVHGKFELEKNCLFEVLLENLRKRHAQKWHQNCEPCKVYKQL